MSELIDELLADARERMAKSVEATTHEFATVRTGRANPSLLDRDLRGLLRHADAAEAAGDDSRRRGAAAHGPAVRRISMKSIEKAITDSDLGLTPSNDGKIIRLSIPELTEERRKELVKVVHRLAEDGRVKIRNVRREVMHDLRELKEAGDVGADDEHRGEGELQKLTDAKVGEVDAVLKAKEDEILEV